MREPRPALGQPIPGSPLTIDRALHPLRPIGVEEDHRGCSCMDIKLEQPVAEASPEADMLVNKTAHFVEEWINEHKTEPRVSTPPEIVAAELADQCIADAESQGIGPDEISEEVGDLKEYIAETVLEEQRDGGGDDHGSIAPAPSAAGNGETNAEIPF
jgi:hypothetical protein